jgi:hypothetical protein
VKARRFRPDLTFGHTGWGETLFIKDVWPKTPLLGYFEFYYRGRGSDADFDPEFPLDPLQRRRLCLRNAINALAFDSVDAGQTPTRWQLRQHPSHMRAHRGRA